MAGEAEPQSLCEDTSDTHKMRTVLFLKRKVHVWEGGTLFFKMSVSYKRLRRVSDERKLKEHTTERNTGPQTGPHASEAPRTALLDQLAKLEKWMPG